MWSVLIPSDSKENVAASASAVLAMHPEMNPVSIVIVTRTIKPEESLKGTTLIQDKDPFVFARCVNLGFSMIPETDFIVMNDDVELTTKRGFDLLAEEASLRLLSPSIRGRVGPWWQQEGRARPDVPFISFMCVYIPRSVYNILGPLDESFPGYGYEDTDYCMRARRAGLSCGVSERVVCEHTVRIPSTFLAKHGENLPIMEREARQAFEKKWIGVKIPPHKLK